MCVCNSTVKTPWCGAPGCEIPKVSQQVRVGLHEYFIGIAKAVSVRSSWDGTKVGAVAVRGKQVVSTGYNGTPAGYDNFVNRSLKILICHAEENVVAQAARHGIKLQDCTLFTTLSPCLRCARIMVNAGVAMVVYAERWDDDEAASALDLLSSCGVLCERMKEEKRTGE